MSKDNEKEVKEKKTQNKKEEKVIKSKEKEEKKKVDSKKSEVEKEENKKEKSSKEENKSTVSKKEDVKGEKTSKELSEKKEKQKEVKKEESKKENVEVITKDSQIREKFMIIGSYLKEKLRDYRFVILLDIIVYLLLFFLMPKVIFDVKPFIWMIGFVLFVILPTVGIYGMNKFRDKQIMFSFFFMYLLIILFIKKFTIIELYGITSQGKLDHTPAWLDAVFVTCIIVFFQYIGILIVNVCKHFGNKKTKKIEK